MKNIVIIGPPGSGKDTQIEKMREYLDFEVVSTGDMARLLADKDAKYRQIVESGGLIDDSIMTRELSGKLDSIDKDLNVVFDGYPRTLHQADLLNEVLSHHGRVLDCVIYLNIAETAVVERLSVRKICAVCKHDLEIGKTKCGICGGEAVQRHDDDPSVVIHRFQTFTKRTLPLIDFYRDKGILIEIDGDQPIESVANNIKRKLGYARK